MHVHDDVDTATDTITFLNKQCALHYLATIDICSSSWSSVENTIHPTKQNILDSLKHKFWGCIEQGRKDVVMSSLEKSFQSGDVCERTTPVSVCSPK
jgi:hypothetical protein